MSLGIHYPVPSSMHSIWILLLGHLGNFTALCLVALLGMGGKREQCSYIPGPLQHIIVAHCVFNGGLTLMWEEKHKIV